MPKYNIYTKIESNVPTSDLFYDLNVYKTDGNNKKHVLLSVTQQPIDPSYYTIYIMYISLVYRGSLLRWSIQ